MHYSVDLRIQTYTEPVSLEYGQLATKYPSIYGYFLQCAAAAAKTAVQKHSYERTTTHPVQCRRCLLPCLLNRILRRGNV